MQVDKLEDFDMQPVFEYRRQKLIELLSREPYRNRKGSHAQLASALKVPPSYVSRMLYEPNKQGRKNIGDEIVAKLDILHPYWLMDELKRQLLTFYDAISEERRDDLIQQANHYFNETHNKPGKHQPFVPKRSTDFVGAEKEEESSRQKLKSPN